jgi:hypothetical protein
MSVESLLSEALADAYLEERELWKKWHEAQEQRRRLQEQLLKQRGLLAPGSTP